MRGPAMANIENTARKLVLKEGSTTLTLDKESGKATLQSKILLWNKKPVEFALSEIDDIAVKSETDGLSGASNPSQRPAPAHGRDHGAHHRGSQGRQGDGEDAARFCWALSLAAAKILIRFSGVDN